MNSGLEKQGVSKIYFVTTWDSNKEKTWSGTTWNLFQALQKRVTTINIDITLQYTRWQNIVRRVSKKYQKPQLEFWLQQRIFHKQKCGKGIVLQFAEIVKESRNTPTYIFQDLSVNYLRYISENAPEIYKYAWGCDFNATLQKRNILQNEYYRTCSGIFVMGHWLANDLVERLGIPAQKVHAVGGGINLNKDDIDSSRKMGNKFLFVGRDFVRKGGDLVYQAFCLLKENRPDVELYFAGPKQNPFPNAISGFHFMGDCEKSQIAELFNLCDVFVMPSHFEAFGIAFVEALSFGLPCIGNNAYEMPYLIEHGKTGYLLENHSVTILAKYMNDALNNEQMKKTVLAKRNFYLQEYSWDSVACRICKAIKE